MAKKQMTLNQFFAALRKTPRDWQFFGRAIRRFPNSHCFSQCPITSLVSDDIGTHCYLEVAKRLGLREPKKIAAAADGAKGYDGNLRERLLKACGLV